MRIEEDYTEPGYYFLYTLGELKKEVDEEYNNMTEDEKYMRLKYNDPTFLQFVYSWASRQTLKENERIKVNEMTNEYEITKIY